MMQKVQIDLNADVAEGIGNEEQLLPYLSSCNICCGAHAGDEEEIRKVIDLAIQYDVVIGAHPSYPDRENFGRQAMKMSTQELADSLQEQLTLITTIAQENGAKVQYVKPHGALYHQAALDNQIATVIIEVTKEFDERMYLLGLPNSIMESKAKELNCPFAAEAFADRLYTREGGLASRSLAGSVLEKSDEVWQQVKSIVFAQQALTYERSTINVQADSICFHGDTANAIALLKEAHKKLLDYDVNIESFIKT